MNKKYLLATCFSLMFLASTCFAATSLSISFWSNDLATILGFIQDKLLVVLGSICVLMIIIGGGMYMTAKEDAAQAKNGMTTVKVALIGLAIVLAAAMLMNFVASLGSAAK
ncbi:MAG: hypothetical protein PHW52_03090 [Candidatus Pacebacteria bacterium]|nr:hypothetical protein [Candidatus Paceibacterota bacterium]